MHASVTYKAFKTIYTCDTSCTHCPKCKGASATIFFRAFLTCQGVSASAEATYGVLRRRALGPHRGPWRLPSTGSCQRTSARPHAARARPRQGCTPLQVGVLAATRRWRAAQRLPVGQTSGQPKLRAAARSGAGTSRARCQASRRSQVAASAPNRPPTSTPTTTKRRRARAQGTSDGVSAARRCRRRGRGARLSVTSPGDGADDGGVYGLLRAMPESKSVRDDFDAAVVSNRHIDIHVGQAEHYGQHARRLLGRPSQPPVQEGGPGR